MSDMKSVIVPKSDQLNADDLLTGEITVKITGVTIRSTPEQPVSISFEGDNGKPYKPCKSMCRVMVRAWGADSAKYVGRSMTLYCDPNVKWGGMAVGGIRISHMSDISGEMAMALTATKGSKKIFTVQPLVVRKPAAAMTEAEKIQRRMEPFNEFLLQVSDVEAKLGKPLLAATKAELEAAYEAFRVEQGAV